MRTLNILTLTRLSAEDRTRIEAVDPAARLTDASGWFDGEYRETWPAFSAGRYLPPGATGKGTREERDALLAEAEIILGSWPFPFDLRSRAPKLKWFHQRAGGCQQFAEGRFVGQRRDGHDVSWCRKYACDRGICGRGDHARRQGVLSGRAGTGIGRV